MRDLNSTLEFWQFLILLLAIFVSSLCLLYSQYKTLKLVTKENRTIDPRLFWLVFIPILGRCIYVWLVSELYNSLRKEFLMRRLTTQGLKHSFRIGIIYAVSSLIFGFYFANYLTGYSNLSNKGLVYNNNYELLYEILRDIVIMLASLISPISLFIYWWKINNYKGILKKHETV